MAVTGGGQVRFLVTQLGTEWQCLTGLLTGGAAATPLTHTIASVAANTDVNGVLMDCLAL